MKTRTVGLGLCIKPSIVIADETLNGDKRPAIGLIVEAPRSLDPPFGLTRQAPVLN